VDYDVVFGKKVIRAGISLVGRNFAAKSGYFACSGGIRQGSFRKVLFGNGFGAVQLTHFGLPSTFRERDGDI